MYLFQKKKTRKGREGREKQECALFQDPDLWTVKERGPSYIKLGTENYYRSIQITFCDNIYAVQPSLQLRE